MAIQARSSNALFMILGLITLTSLVGCLAARKFDEPTTNSADGQLAYEICSSDLISCRDNQGNIFPKDSTTLRDRSIETIDDLQKDYFLESALVEGGRMTLAENLHDPAPKKAFLTASAATKLPSLTSANVNQLLQHFNVARNSDMATHIATAAYLCSTQSKKALHGEAKSCVASMDAMAAFVLTELGPDVKVYTTTGAPTTAPAVKAPVTIVDVVKGSIAEGKKVVVCHHLAFPSALYSCHLVSDTKIVQASLKSDSVTSTAAPIIHGVGVCHLNTAAKGGESCHFLVENDIVFAPAMIEME